MIKTISLHVGYFFMSTIFILRRYNFPQNISRFVFLVLKFFSWEKYWICMKYAYYFIERVMVTWELCRGFIKVSVFFFFSDCVFPLCKLIQVFCIFFSLPLNAWYNKKLRIMANSTKKSHVKNIDLHQKMGTYPLPYILQKRRLKYIGHVVRYPDDR